MWDYFDRERSLPSNLLDLMIVNRLVMHDPIPLTYLLVDSMVLVDQLQWLPEQRLHERHDYGFVLLRHCVQNGNGDRMDRSQRCEMFDTARFCIWDDVAGYVVRLYREQIDIFHRIYMHQPLQTDDKVRFYIWKWSKWYCYTIGSTIIYKGRGFYSIILHFTKKKSISKQHYIPEIPLFEQRNCQNL